MSGGWLDMVSDLICIFASVCFAYQPIFELCYILLSLLLLLLKDVDMNYSNTVSNTARKPKKQKHQGRFGLKLMIYFSGVTQAFFLLTSKNTNNFCFLDKGGI